MKEADKRGAVGGGGYKPSKEVYFKTSLALNIYGERAPCREK